MSTNTCPDAPLYTSRLLIDLDAICKNWRYLDAMTDDDCHTGAVIKADCYGMGVTAIAPALWQAGCRYFFTARLSEAIAARTLLPDAHIIVFDGLRDGEEDSFYRHNLIACLNDLEQIAMAKAFTAKQNTPLPICLALDTGMSRLGLSDADWQKLTQQQDWRNDLDIRLLLSHLSSSDDSQSPHNARQNNQLANAVTDLDIPISLANSGGILLGQQFHHTLTRPGIALYGIAPDKAEQGLSPVMSLTADILQIREIETGTSVGYGADFVAEKPMRLATLGIGYADGIQRHYKEYLRPKIGEYECDIIGRISMDSLVIDITEVPGDVIANHSCAILLDDSYNADDLANDTGTISYEILTLLGERVQRHYHGEMFVSGKNEDKA